jgi:hypothetical protein
MKKLKSLTLLILILAFVFVFIGWNYLPYWVSSDLSRKMGVDVSISYINLGPRKIGIFNINIDNPSGYTLKQALDVKKLVSRAPITAYLKDNVVIDQIVLSNAYLGLEIKSPLDKTSNWTQIMDQLKNSLNQTGGDSKNILIKSLIVENLNIDLVVKSTSNKVKRIKPIQRMEFKNISSQGAFPASQLTQIIMKEVLKEVLSPENFSNMLKQTLENPVQGTQDIMNSIKSLFSFSDY